MTSTGSYWQRFTSARLGRRRALGIGLAGLAGVGALSLVGCGGSDGEGTKSAPKLTMFTSNSEEGPVKRGGTWSWGYNAEPATLDPYAQTASAVYTVLYATMSKLVQVALGPGKDPANFEVAGDAAKSWEISPDLLTYTFKLNPAMKFHNIAPVNGRQVDSGDVKLSWQRLEKHAFYGTFFGFTKPAISTPDPSTVVFKLSSPDVAFMAALIEPRASMIMAKESDGGYDARDKAIGSGPWILANRVPSSNIDYKRNPDWIEQNVPYMDGMTGHLISEPSVMLSQFQAKNLPSYTPEDPENLVDLLRENPTLRIVEGLRTLGSGGVGFERRDPGGPGPFTKDKRLRQALSMMIDRDAVYTALGGLDAWKKLGVQLPIVLDNFVAAAFQKYWTDPRGKEMGDSAKFFAYDVAEAKKLLAAANYPSDYAPDFHFAASFQSDKYRSAAQVVANMLQEGGIKVKPYADDYNLEYQAKSQIGENTGLLFTNLSSGSSDASGNLDELFAPAGRRNQLKVDDPMYNDLAAKARTTVDEKERRKIFIELQRYLGNEMRWTPVSFGTPPVTAFWPHVKNNGTYRGGTHYSRESHFWLDKA